MDDKKSLLIIVTYNSSGFIESCLRSIVSQTYRDWFLLVLDNHSTDDTVGRIRKFRNQTPQLNSEKFRLVRLKKNMGFSGAVDHGVFNISDWGGGKGYRYLVLLNPDMLLFPDALENLISVFGPGTGDLGDHRNGGPYSGDDIGVAGGLILDYDRDIIQHRGGRITSNFITYHEGVGESYHYNGRTGVDADEGSLEVSDYVTGAFFATRYRLFTNLGGFDRGYRPVYFEELDYCLKLREAGWKVVSSTAAVSRHFEGASVKKFSTRFYRHYHKNRLRCVILNMDLPDLVMKFLPAEIKWLRKSATRDQAGPLAYAYLLNAVFLVFNLVLRIKNHFILNRIELK